MERSGIDLHPPVDSRRRTAHQLVRDSLRQAILTGSLPGGTRLVQSDIAAQLEVSTTPVREAMRDLATEGLIQLHAHRGATVYKLDNDEVREIYHLRKLLEPEALRRAAHQIQPNELREAWELCERMDSEHDPNEWADHNTRFHDILIHSARSPRLIALLDMLRSSSAPYIALALRTKDRPIAEHNRHHRQMLKYLEQGDGEGAGRVVVESLEATLREFEQSALAANR